ncbi:hypothetical protein PybrP1_007876 [[Pythium] brassicae (nom. inval.)]|nr:hypothetical protein PybrP1_007876 [[Pythium] brassicae (nom. inval.)]
MWLSSFASTGASAPLTVNALVWSAETVVADAKAPLAPEDALVLATTADIRVLRHLRVVNGSYPSSSSSNSDGGGDDAAADAPATAIGDVTLSPLLAFNLGIPLHAANNKRSTAQIGLAAAPSAATAFRRKHQEQPAEATHATIAPLLVSSLSCRHHALLQQRDGLFHAIRTFFARAHVLQEGDVFAVPLRETAPALPPAHASASAYEPYKRVAIPASFIVASDSASPAVVLPPVLTVDTSLVFFRVERLEGAGKEAAHALRVSASTELLQTTTVSAPAPDEGVVTQFLSHCEALRASALDGAVGSLHGATPAAPTSAALAQLYEILYPSQLCDVPVSVLLSGARGVGKTTLVHEAAKQLGVCVVEVPFTELTGASELHLLENLREQVARTQALAPCLLYVSRLFPVEKDNEEAALRLGAALAECLRSLSRQPRNTPLVACVEDVNDVPKFVRQCFLYELALDAPDQAARRAFFQHAAATTTAFGDDVDLDDAAQLTAGRTCGELSALVADAGALAVERLLQSSVSMADDDDDDNGDGDNDSDDDDDLLSRLARTDDTVDVSISRADLAAAIKSQQAQSSASKGGNASIPNVKWEDVGGLDDVKDEILDVVQLPIKHPELFASGVRQRVKGPELLNMYIGESEKNVRQVFAKARSCRPCILFFDELDSLAPMRGRGSDSGGVMDRVVSQLLTEIDGLSGGGNDQVFVVGATNRPDLLETGLLRPGRFDRLLYLGICNEKPAQLKVVQALTRRFALAPDVDLPAVVADCPLNFTGADFYALCSSALAAAMKARVAALDQQIEEINAEDCYSSSPMTVRMLLSRLPPEELLVPVAQEHFLSALQHVVPSVSPAELQHYERLKEQFSSKQDK